MAGGSRMTSGYDKFFKDVRKARKDKRLSRAKKSTFPIRSLMAIFAMLVASIFLLVEWDNVDSVIKKTQVRIFSFAIAEDAKDKADVKKNQEGQENKSTNKKDEEKNAQSSDGEGENVKNEKQRWTPEEIILFSKLDSKKKELDQREVELNKLEEELQKQKVVLENKMKELDQIREKISTQLSNQVQMDEEKVAKLVEFYSSMKPANAAKILSTINEDLAVEVLGKMKKKEAAEILNLLEPDKSQKLSEKYAGYKNH